MPLGMLSIGLLFVMALFRIPWLAIPWAVLAAVFWLLARKVERLWEPSPVPPEWHDLLREFGIDKVYFAGGWRWKGSSLTVPLTADITFTTQDLRTVLGYDIDNKIKRIGITILVAAACVTIGVFLVPEGYGVVAVFFAPHLVAWLERLRRPPKVARIYDRFRL